MTLLVPGCRVIERVDAGGREEPERRWRDQLIACPPEVLCGEQREPDVPWDVFGLAAVLHYALTGRGLYGGP